MEDDYDPIYVGDDQQRPKKSSFLKLIILRLPSLALADFILFNSDYIFNEINRIFTIANLNIITYFAVQIISRIILAFMILVCLLMISLKFKLVLNMYKLLALISLPFVFTFTIKFAQQNTIAIFSIQIPVNILICLIYSVIVSLTIFLYSEIYQNIIYIENFKRMSSEQVVGGIRLDTVALSSSSEEEDDEQVDISRTNKEYTITSALKKRQIYIMLYSLCSLIANETDFFALKSSETKDNINLMSLGYLLMLFYDLSVNLDQMLFLLSSRIRHIGQQVQNFGLNNILIYNWFERIRVPLLFRCFFFAKLTIFTLQFFFNPEYFYNLNQDLDKKNTKDNFVIFDYLKSALNITNPTFEEYANLGLEKYEFLTMFFGDSFFIVYLKFAVLSLSETSVSIAAITSIISLQFYLLGQIVNKMTNITEEQHYQENRQQRRWPQENDNNNENELLNVGDVAAVLFFLLCVQSSLSDLNGKHRIEKFFKNYSLLFIAILHYLHNNLNIKLMQLSASSKPLWYSKKHLRVIGVALFLIVIPIIILNTLWLNFSVSTWLLALSAFNIELIIKLIVSLVVYTLVIVQYKQDKNEVHDKIDEWIYIIRVFGHTFEFFVAIFLFFNGAYILFFENYGAIRTLMMCIHAYFHIFLQAKKGWTVYTNRRTAMLKISRLPILSTNEKEFNKKLNDLCAICFCELKILQSRILQCSHCFHSICLKKWLRVQSTCPMCQKVVN